MPIEYKIFYVDYNCECVSIMINKMNELITSKMNEGWKLVGGVTIIDQDGIANMICQAMTFVTLEKDLLE